MSATLTWKESNTVSEVVTTATNLNFGASDSPNLVVATYPIRRGTNSFDKYIRILFSGTWTTISNMLFWKSAGTLLTDEVINCGYNETFATPSQTTNGDSAVPTTSGGSSAIQSDAGNATIVYGVDTGYTKYLRLQTRSTTSTPSGAANQKTFIFQWDEI